MHSLSLSSLQSGEQMLRASSASSPSLLISCSRGLWGSGDLERAALYLVCVRVRLPVGFRHADLGLSVPDSGRIVLVVHIEAASL